MYAIKKSVTLCFLLLSLLVSLVPETFGQTYVIKAGYLFDSRSGQMLKGQMIAVKNGQITAVGENLKIQPADSVIDLSASWVLPGLMDCHVHITDNEPYRQLTGTIPLGYFTESTAFRALRGGFVAEQFLKSGFTTIKEIGNDANYATADVIKAIRQGWIKGPDIFYAGKIIAPYGGQTRRVNIEHELDWNFEYLDADSPDEIRKAIRKNRYYGANVIKLVTGDNGIYSAADIKAAVEEANKYGIKVTVHVAENTGANEVIQGGAAAIEHGFALDNTQLQQMKDKGMFLVGTDFSFGNWFAYGMDSATAIAMNAMVVDRLKRAYKIGTKMAFGTDIIVDIPGYNRVETSLKVLESWKAAGIPAHYILQTMTIHAAELLGVSNNKGTIAPGYLADIIAVDQNPIDNIDAVKKVKFVMKRGEVIVK